MPYTQSLIQERREAGEKLLIKVLDELKKVCFEEKIEMELLEGITANEILRAAKEWNAHLILLGNCGKSNLEKIFSGSVSQAVSSRAKCSVLVART